MQIKRFFKEKLIQHSDAAFAKKQKLINLDSESKQDTHNTKDKS